MRLHRKRSDVEWLMLLFLPVCLLWGLVSPRPPKLEALYSSRTGARATIKRSRSAIAVAADGVFCLVANPDSDSLTRYPRRRVRDPHQLSLSMSRHPFGRPFDKLRTKLRQAYPSPGSEHDVSGLLSEAKIQDLIAFMLALPMAD